MFLEKQINKVYKILWYLTIYPVVHTSEKIHYDFAVATMYPGVMYHRKLLLADGDSYRSSEILALSVRTGDDPVSLYCKHS